jgi:hypothetical protein
MSSPKQRWSGFISDDLAYRMDNIAKTAPKAPPINIAPMLTQLTTLRLANEPEASADAEADGFNLWLLACRRH